MQDKIKTKLKGWNSSKFADNKKIVQKLSVCKIQDQDGRDQHFDFSYRNKFSSNIIF